LHPGTFTAHETQRFWNFQQARFRFGKRVDTKLCRCELSHNKPRPRPQSAQQLVRPIQEKKAFRLLGQVAITRHLKATTDCLSSDEARPRCSRHRESILTVIRVQTEDLTVAHVLLAVASTSLETIQQQGGGDTHTTGRRIIRTTKDPQSLCSRTQTAHNNAAFLPVALLLSNHDIDVAVRNLVSA